MNDQSNRASIRHIALITAAIATSLIATWAFAQALGDDHWSLVDLSVVGLFFVLTSWIALWFWVTTVGFWQTWQKIGSDLSSHNGPSGEELPRTAILLPVFNEEPGAVFARIKAMLASLQSTGQAPAFDFFVLSDTTDPDIWLDEERTWLEVRSELERPSAVFYRRRSANTERKAGNIADFCRRWGGNYPYMIVLDADSLMEGATFVELVRRMDADPKLGILQTPPLPLGKRSLMSRCQQFAAKLCGRMLAEGFDWFAGDSGNYWGHNAILRTAAFTRYCGLSKLPGEAPLGGEILSHDFVEAALMGRAGYKVRLAADLTQSYEQSPTTLPEYAQRDQRWCQGNLQHSRLAVSRRIPPANRFHFLTGILAYVSSPLWLAFLLLGPFVYATGEYDSSFDGSPPHSPYLQLKIFLLVMAMLLMPRFYGFLLALRNPGERCGYGGARRLVLSVIFEIAVSVILAPIMMAFHSLFVGLTLVGRRVHWKAQRRNDGGVSLAQAFRVHWWQMAAGVAATVAMRWWMPHDLLWFSPVLFGLVFAVPISMALSDAGLGGWFKQHGLLQVPEEYRLPPVVQAYRRTLQDDRQQDRPRRAELFEELLRDPKWLHSHFVALEMTTTAEAASDDVAESVTSLISNGAWRKISAMQRREILLDPSALERLHRLLWVKQSEERCEEMEALSSSAPIVMLATGVPLGAEAS